MITKTSSITTSAIHGFAIGDKIAIDVPDTRWWSWKTLRKLSV